MVEVLALGAALSMDVTAVAAARGLARPRLPEILGLALVFALAHAVMLTIGWTAGAAAADAVAAWDHWIAFAVLAGLGVKSLAEALGDDDDDDGEVEVATDWKTIGLLAIATSIDAVAAGLTLPLLPSAPGVSIAVIAIVVATFTAAGSALGRLAGKRIGGHLHLLGGVALIAIGAKILIEHLTA